MVLTDHHRSTLQDAEVQQSMSPERGATPHPPATTDQNPGPDPQL